MTNILLAMVFPFVTLVFWEIACHIADDSGIASGKMIVLPAPSLVFLRLVELINHKDITLAMLRTVWISILGISLGIIGAIAIGVLVGGTKLCGKYIGPTLHFLRTLPVITYVPLSLVIFGSDIRTPVFLAGFVTTLYGALPIGHAVARFDQEKIIFLKIRGITPFRIAASYILPEIVAALTASISVIVTLAIAICVVAEMLLPSLGGIGFWLLRMKEISDYEGLWACTILLGLSGYILHTVVTGLWQYATPWSVYTMNSGVDINE
jgi:sulfonate transport system permease protein